MRGSPKIKADRRAGMRVVTSLTGSNIGVVVDIIIGIVVVVSLESKRIIINNDNSLKQRLRTVKSIEKHYISSIDIEPHLSNDGTVISG